MTHTRNYSCASRAHRAVSIYVLRGLAAEYLKRIDSACQWWLGDWLNFGERKYGEMYAQAVDETDAAYQTLRNYKWVAGAFQLSRRRDNVPFGVHREIAALPEAEREAALDIAAEEGWTVRESRQHVKLLKAAAGKRLNVLPPEGTYSTIVIDPPWPMEKIEREVRPKQTAFDYPVMSEDQILKISHALPR